MKKREFMEKINLRGESTVVRVNTSQKGGVVVTDVRSGKKITSSKKYSSVELLNRIEDNRQKVAYAGRRGYKNFFIERSDYVRRKKVGRVFLRIEFKKGKEKQIVEGDSGFSVPLVSKNERARAEAQAFNRCLSQLNFYEYTGFTILLKEYWYNTPRENTGI